MATNAHTDESGDRCTASLPTARVENTEHLAFLVSHPKTCDEEGMPTEGAFPFATLNLRSADTEKYPHNRCGESEGLSLERTDPSCREYIDRQSQELASAFGTNETPHGAAISTAGELRSLRLASSIKSSRPGKHEITPHEQIAFVLADGKAGKEKHAVLRFHPETDRVIHAKIREKVRSAFVPFSAWS